ncbi:MAG: DUF177 domain-containing protein [Firmicutes bacterium]|nr:DUF177 domain-containing protein [Bacillota bacterium]
MQVNIGPIKDQKGGEFSFRLEEDWSDLKMDGQPLGFVSPVVLKGKIGWTGECFLLRGTIETEMKIACARCLEPKQLRIQAEIMEEFRRAHHRDGQDEYGDDTGAKDDWADEDIQEFRGLVIDLDEVVLDNLLVSVPIKPLCKEDCRGLCPQCGQDLNKGECSCEIDDINPHMDILRKLLDSGD